MRVRYGSAAVMAAVVFSAAGCATVKEGAKGFAGLSTRTLEESRPKALAQVFPQPPEQVLKNTREHLQLMGCYIYARNDAQGLTAVYLGGDDTTPVGVFVTAAEQGGSKVEVSSPSTYAREFLSGRLFALLSGKPDPELERLKKQKQEDEKQ
jgi:hypothetical protein